MRSPGRILDRTPPALLFLISGFGQYYGLALAVGLFASASATAVAWARIALAAVFMIPWRRPWRQRWTRREWLATAAFGVVLALMNLTFYTAADHLPMGPAVAIEFIGPISIAAITGRGWRMRVGVVLATVGIVLLAGAEARGGWTRDSVIGLIAILAAALCWATYILLGRSIATARDGVTSLAVGMAVGGVLFAPFFVGAAIPLFTDWRLLLTIVVVALLSSVVPYSTEQVIMRRVTAAQFAVLTALLPVCATLNGALVLHQIPSVTEIIGIVAVCGAIVLSVPRDAGEPAN